jgi:hypothetical protein
MKKYSIVIAILISCFSFAQDKDSTATFKKRVLDATEVDYLISYYKQDGIHSAVSGGMGSEKLTDLASNIVVSMPLNADDILTVDVGISAYTSASSSNINPFNGSGASGGGGDDDKNVTEPYGTPWLASSGASAEDQLAKLFNEKNTELSLKANAYLDQWRPIYPTELNEYSKYGSNFLNAGYFAGVTVYDQNANSSIRYLPSKFEPWQTVNRNSYSLSFSFSQILTKKLQASLFFDVLQQEGMLSTPYHRIYFADKPNYYIGQTQYIPVYETAENIGVYRLADDVERLPSTRFKVPIGIRFNYYVNETLKVRTYYRYYSDDWGITAHTANIEVPFKLSDQFTVYPMYRYFTQTASKYFAPFETHLSTEEYYTSDYDLSKFSSNQYGLGASHVDIFTKAHIWKFGLKNIDFRYNHYSRSDTLEADIASMAFKFIFQ